MIGAAEEQRVTEAASSTRVDLGYGPGRVDPFDALEKSGVEVLVYPFPYKALDGIYRRGERASWAAINSARPLSRQRFTAAHELAHHVLDADKATFWDVETGGHRSPLEERADLFAAVFLMDQPTIRRVISGAATPEDSALRVVSAFGVSVNAAIRRLLTLELINDAEAKKVGRIRNVAAKLTGLHLSAESTKTTKERRISYEPLLDDLIESMVVPKVAGRRYRNLRSDDDSRASRGG